MIDSSISRASRLGSVRSSIAGESPCHSAAAQSGERGRHVTITASYVNRRPPRSRSQHYRPISPQRTIDDHWRQRRSCSPLPSRPATTPVPFSSQLEIDIEKLIRKFKLRSTQKKQMRLFLELGLTMEELQKLVQKRLEVLNHRPSTIKRKFEFLVEYTDMNREQFKKFFLKFPRILEYNMKKTVQPRLDFLLSLGLQKEDLAKILIQAPAVTELSVQNTLAPRIEFFRSVLGIRSEHLCKTIRRNPQLLTNSEESMSARVAFLQEWNMSATEIAHVVERHPQILHYRVQSMSEHIRFLLHIGIERNNIRRIINRFPQILSLDLKVNVIPKVHYLQSKLGGTTEMLENNPVFMGLSLKKRIIPRHRFLSSLKTVELQKPIPMNWFKVSDAVFASNIAKVPLEEFIAFKNQCLKE